MRRLFLGLFVFTIASAFLKADEAARFLPLLQQKCAGCHGEKKQKGKFALHDINPNFAAGGDIERWEKILEMVSIGDMPPEEEPQLEVNDREELVQWLTTELQKLGRGPDKLAQVLPQHGNRVDHNALFSGEHKGPAYTTSRLWRISPFIYYRFAADIDMARKLSSPVQDTGAKGIRDYSYLRADEAAINTALRNSKRAAFTLIHGVPQRTRNRGNQPVKQGTRRTSRHRAFADFVKAEGSPSRKEMSAVLDYALDLLFERKATPEDQERYLDGFFIPNVELAGRDLALQSLLSALMLSPEFMFRLELGLGKELPDGRRMLAPRELAYALSFAVFDYIEPGLLKAANDGKLQTKADVAREFRRILTQRDRKVRTAANKWFWDTGKGAGISTVKSMDVAYPRLLRFFQEYFGYTKAPDVFKDDTRHDGKHKAWDLVTDANWLVLRALKDDQQVLARLLTGDQYFVQSRSRKPIKDARSYNLDSPSPPLEGNPQKMPVGQRAGILTHPAWLVAHSGNFENDPVRRGRWIQEHLLAGVVPDIPIGVEAQLPEEPEHTLRKRFRVVQAEECWRCHKKMNPLGNPFEAYDDFGRFRTHHLRDEKNNVLATEFEAYSRLRKVAWRDSHPKNHPPEEFTEEMVDTTGELRGTGDPNLDGKVTGPLDLMQRLAKSDRVRQCFIRHVFRYWMGRNETLNDSPTLMAMDRAYLDSDGSFRELLVALVTSDSFLYRKTPAP